MILPAGTFNVSERRKPIPAAVEREVRKRYQLDHRPALAARPYDTEAGDFVPSQNDPRFIFLVEAPEHDERTFGRKADAEKTVTTRNSDVGERARSRAIRDSRRLHEAVMAEKVGDTARARDLRSSVERKTRLKPKRKIPSRPFPKQHRPVRAVRGKR